MHAHVSNGQVDRFGTVTPSGDTFQVQDGDITTGYTTAAEVKAAGWLPVVEERATLGPDQHYGPVQHTVRADDVLATYPAEADSPEQINERAIITAMGQAIVQLDVLIAAPAVAVVPAGTLTVAQLSNIARQTRDSLQETRAGAQQVAATLKRVVRLLRGDFSTGA